MKNYRLIGVFIRLSLSINPRKMYGMQCGFICDYYGNYHYNPSEGGDYLLEQLHINGRASLQKFPILESCDIL